MFAQDDNLTKGIEFFNNGNYAASRDFFQAVIEVDNTNDWAFYYLGRSESFLGNMDKAESYFKKAIDLNNANSAYYHGLGENYLLKLQQSNHFEKGILAGKVLDNYKKAVNIDPSNIPARISLANYYINAPSIGGGSISKAKEQVLEIEKYNPGQAVLLMAQIYMQEENYEMAIEEFDNYLDDHPDDTQVLYRLGMIYQGIKKYKEASASFELAVEIDPEAYSSLYQIGRTAIFWEQNLNRGIKAMEDYIEANPGSPNPSLDAAHWRLGMLHELNDNNKAALKEYTLAFELKPEEKKYRDAIENLQ